MADEQESGEYAHGWQYAAASRRETFYRDGALAAQLSGAQRSLLHSQAGCCAGAHLTALPVNTAGKWNAARLRTLLLRRLRLPLHLADKRCRCGRVLDAAGDHRTACSTAGVLQSRALPQEDAWRQVCREAGGRVRKNVFVRDMNVGAVLPTDDRRLECLVTGLPLHNGAQLAVDATLVSPLTRTGAPHPKTVTEPGAALRHARKKKEDRYPELVTGQRCKLVVVGMEVGGRWAPEAYNFLTDLARAKAREAPTALRGSAYRSWLRRWTTLVSVATLAGYADTLLQGSAANTETWHQAPELSTVLCEDAHVELAGPSHLGLRL